MITKTDGKKAKKTEETEDHFTAWQHKVARFKSFLDKKSFYCLALAICSILSFNKVAIFGLSLNFLLNNVMYFLIDHGHALIQTKQRFVKSKACISE